MNKDESLLEIASIKLKLPNREIEMTADEARKVFAELQKLFAIEKEVVLVEKIVEKPIYIDRYPPHDPPWQTTPWIPMPWTPSLPTQPWIVGDQPNSPVFTCLNIDLSAKNP